MFVPPVKLLSIDGYDAVVEAVNVYKAGAFNQPGKVLTGSLLSSSTSLAAYLICETLFALTIGQGSQYRCHHMVNSLLSGLVIVTGLSALTEPLICVLLGAIGGVVYCFTQRIFSRYKVINGEMSIVFGVMTLCQVICTAIFSSNRGLIAVNNQS